MQIPQALKKINWAYVFWSLLILGLVAKFFLLTAPVGNMEFLTKYKFMPNDSYDWIVNGVYFLDPILSSFRNPGLALIIKLLWGLNILYLLPLLNQLIFGALILVVFKTSQLLTIRRWIPYVIVIFMFWNFTFQDFANLILADYYSILFIAFATYWLIKQRRNFALFALGISGLFQNFAFFLFPIWFIYIYFQDQEWLRGAIKPSEIFLYFKKHWIEWVKYLLIAFNFNLIWFGYKWLTFGKPLYTGVIQFELISPNFNSALFYLINSYTIFGLVFLLVIVWLFTQWRKYIDYKETILLVGGGIVALGFWTILYDWNDRRFLLYLIPFLYPLFAFFWDKVSGKLNWWKGLILLLILYPTTIALPNALAFNIVPITNWNAIEFTSTIDTTGGPNIHFPSQLVQTPAYLVHTPFPAIGTLWANRTENRTNIFAKYTDNTDIITATYNSKTNTVCNPPGVFSNYVFNSIFKLNTGKSLTEVTRLDCK